MSLVPFDLPRKVRNYPGCTAVFRFGPHFLQTIFLYPSMEHLLAPVNKSERLKKYKNEKIDNASLYSK